MGGLVHGCWRGAGSLALEVTLKQLSADRLVTLPATCPEWLDLIGTEKQGLEHRGGRTLVTVRLSFGA